MKEICINSIVIPQNIQTKHVFISTNLYSYLFISVLYYLYIFSVLLVFLLDTILAEVNANSIGMANLHACHVYKSFHLKKTLTLSK